MLKRKKWLPLVQQRFFHAVFYFEGGIMRKWRFIVSQLVLFFIIISVNAEEVNTNMELTSPNFENQKSIAKKFTCDGGDISPGLGWSGAPEGTKSFGLIVDDPDAPDPANPRMTWVHWVLYNIPATVSSLPEGVKDKDLPEGTLQGLNDWKKTGYGGPCPPIGTHRYFHKLYALDIVLPDLKSPTKAKLEKAMEGHIIAKAELIGLYQRK
ncbi:MAG: YbhB/YbcL family Raf kinase inhibitor-like protein [Desulfobacterales bacterium]